MVKALIAIVIDDNATGMILIIEVRFFVIKIH